MFFHPLTALAVLLVVVNARPAPQDTSNLDLSISSGNETRITTFPVCGTLGFTEVPGDNEIGVWPPPPVSRHVCVSSCHRNGTCKAVSYAKQYKLCSYYSKYMKDDHLIEDGSSNFEHYDEVCRKRGY
ncbi:hypothetical protein MMC31_005691 [Peltigera leucophlebia]|nr:hypothetical protein [Peltigera leucophlebia]